MAVEYFTRWPEARSLKAANAQIVVTFIYEEIICRFGPPKVFQSDRGTHFVNEIISRLTKRFEIYHSQSSPYHPQSNGLVERFNKTLCEEITKVAENLQEWNKYIQPILYAYRTKELAISKTSPYKLVYGMEPKVIENPEVGIEISERLLEITNRVPQLRASARKAIKEAQDKINLAFGEKERLPKFKIGDLVLVYDKAKAAQHHRKLENKWKGPYEITAVLGKGAYRVMIDGKQLNTTYNEDLLKLFHSRTRWEPQIVV